MDWRDGALSSVRVTHTKWGKSCHQKEFEQRLKEAMNQYHNHNLSVLEILEELIMLAKEFDARQKRGKSWD